MRIFILSAALAVLAAAPAGAECGLGAGGVGFGGFGALAYCQPEGSRWRLGAEYGSVRSARRSPSTGQAITRSRETMAGLFAHRQFTPGPGGRWYAAGALLNWRRTERSVPYSDSDSDSDLSPYFGVGWWRRSRGGFFLDLGVLSSPWARLKTTTSVSTDDSRGAADLHVVLGASF